MTHRKRKCQCQLFRRNNHHAHIYSIWAYFFGVNMSEKKGFLSGIVDFLTSVYARNLHRNFSKDPDIVNGLRKIVKEKKDLQDKVKVWCKENPEACANMRKRYESYRTMTGRPLSDPSDPWNE
jgi:hypothetical protein